MVSPPLSPSPAAPWRSKGRKGNKGGVECSIRTQATECGPSIHLACLTVGYIWLHPGVDLGLSGSLDGICFFNPLNTIIAISNNKETVRQRSICFLNQLNSHHRTSPAPTPLRGLPPNGLFLWTIFIRCLLCVSTLLGFGGCKAQPNSPRSSPYRACHWVGDGHNIY